MLSRARASLAATASGPSLNVWLPPAEPRDPLAVNLAMGRAFEIDVAAIGFERMLKKARSDRARLDQRHIDGSPFELDTKRVGESFDGEFEAQ